MHRFFTYTILTVVVLVLRGPPIQAQSFEYDPYKDFCLRSGHATAVLDDKLYIDGGRIILQSRKPRNFTNTKLLYHDLTTLENPHVNTGQYESPPINWNVSKDSRIPSVVGGSLWADQTNGKLYQFGGEYPDNVTPDDYSLWSYDTWYDRWTKIERSEGSQDIHRLSYGAGTTVEHLGMAYYLGGFRGRMNDNAWTGEKQISSHFLMYSMVGNFWSNRSGPADGVGRAEGVMNFIPAGDSGLLIYFGGIISENGSEANATEAPMSQIQIYDVSNERWYAQTATGDIPKPRRRFCAGAASAVDGSSHNIYLYGGRGFGNDTLGFDDVYVLTLPAFRWIQLWPDDSKNGARPHYDLSCNVVNNGQMIIIGGIFPGDPEAKMCDIPGDAGVHILQLSKSGHGGKEYWGAFNPDTKEYQVPPEIFKIVGGGPGGGANLRTPEVGFSASDLSKLFSRRARIIPRKPLRTRVDQVKFAEPEPEKRSPLSSIIGSVFGGLLLASIMAFWYIRRRRHRKRREAELKAAAILSTSQMTEEPPIYSEYNRYPGPPVTHTINAMGTAHSSDTGNQNRHLSGPISIPSPVYSHHGGYHSPISPGSDFQPGQTGVMSTVEERRGPIAELDGAVEIDDGRRSPQMFQKGGGGLP